MKERITGALFIVGVLPVAYFLFDGIPFHILLVASMLLATVEVYVVLDERPWQVNPDACRPQGAFAYQLAILIVAIAACFFVSRDDLALVVGTSMASDVGAYAIGSLCGRHKVKFLHKISAKKSYEGFLGGIIVGAAAASLLVYLLGMTFSPAIIAYICVGGFVASVGDLLGSACKRQLGVKDSGEVLAQDGFFAIMEAPLKGHGGYLDRFDSISLNLLVYGILHIAML